jgi:hypothetical protein
VVGPGAGPVAALTCAEHPDGSPEAIASGTERLSSEDRFLDHFDYAVIGTVTEIRTVEAGQPDYGATTITVSVEGLLGQSPAPDQIEINSPDPGWMSGYPYRRGTTYFIPVQTEGPDGQPNYSFLCDPISEVQQGVTGELSQLAAQSGITFSTPDAVPPTPPKEPAEEEAAASDDGSSFKVTPLTAIAAFAIVSGLIVLAFALRSRTRSMRVAA